MTLVQGIRTTLADGTPILVRLIRPSDAPALITGFSGLSEQSVAFRFLTAMAGLDDDAVRRFTGPDHLSHEAVGAAVLSGSRQVPVGIAHAFRSPDAPDRAELALTVVDAYHGRGIGRLLVAALALRVARRGIDWLDAEVHGRNRPMAGLLTDLGAEEVPHPDTRHFSLRLQGDPARYPQTAGGDVMRTMAGLAE